MPHTFIVKDAEGVEHTYDLTLHRTEDGAPLAAWVTGHAFEALALAFGAVGVAAIEKMAQAKKGAGLAAIAATIASNPEVMAQLDPAKVGAAVRGVLLKLSVPMQLRILRTTNRDGKPLVDGDGSPAKMYSTAYPKNYRELGEALVKVCQVNGFFPALGALSDAGKAAIAAMPSTTESED